MTQPIPYTPDSEQFDELIRSYVLANRVNDVLAAPSTKRYRDYAHSVRSGFVDDPWHDESDQYRERARELVPRALDAYEYRHGVTLQRNLCFVHSDVKIAALPDAIDGPLMGITVHVRKTEATYEQACKAGITNPMFAHAQAMMLITQRPYWVHCNYYEDAQTRTRKLSEDDVEFDKGRADVIERAMLEFLLHTRTEAVSDES